MNLQSEYRKVKGFYLVNPKVEKGFFKPLKKFKNYLTDDLYTRITKKEVAEVYSEIVGFLDGMGEETYHQAIMKDFKLTDRLGGEYYNVINTSDIEEVYKEIVEGSYRLEDLNLTALTENFEITVVGKKGFARNGSSGIPADQIWSRIIAKTEKACNEFDIYVSEFKEIGFKDLEDLM